uniref:Uncharacterized protein n=1 Tax=Periophthalmus magnuspinnatus TaxID=409849 RepID=A0A3B3ZCN4_9GOBI
QLFPNSLQSRSSLQVNYWMERRVMDREKENQAAIRIQSWVRACRVQVYISHLHKKAVIIQKIWRGFRARSRFRQMVKVS